MLDDILPLIACYGHTAERHGDVLHCGDIRVPVTGGIPRFTPDITYVTGNFSTLREKFPIIQHDSKNGTTDRYDTILERTNWPADFFKGKTVLECGCGAGPDTEILLKLGAKVIAVDLSVDAAHSLLGENPNVTFIQGDITNLPIKPQSVDIVFCHRVLQHTPNPAQTLDHILQRVKPDGAVFVHSYARSFSQICRWKYAMLPFTRRMKPEKLYAWIEGYAPHAFRITNRLRRLGFIGKAINHFLIPFTNYRHAERYKNLSDEEIIAYGVHDTFDALSPAYDKPISSRRMRKIAKKHLQKPFEIAGNRGITLLRSTL